LSFEPICDASKRQEGLWSSSDDASHKSRLGDKGKALRQFGHDGIQTLIPGFSVLQGVGCHFRVIEVEKRDVIVSTSFNLSGPL
jgi:hypothetical protein